MAEQDKTIFRRRKSRFTSISNTPLQDRRLSLDAVGLLACVMSLPEDWNFNRAWAKKRFSVGKEKLERIIKELITAGYVQREQERGEAGRMAHAVYIFTDEPGEFSDVDPASSTVGGFPAGGLAVGGKPATTKYLLSTKDEKEKKERAPACDAEARRARLDALAQLRREAAAAAMIPAEPKRWQASPAELDAFIRQGRP